MGINHIGLLGECPYQASCVSSLLQWGKWGKRSNNLMALTVPSHNRVSDYSVISEGSKNKKYFDSRHSSVISPMQSLDIFTL